MKLFPDQGPRKGKVDRREQAEHDGEQREDHPHKDRLGDGRHAAEQRLGAVAATAVHESERHGFGRRVLARGQEILGCRQRRESIESVAREWRGAEGGKGKLSELLEVRGALTV